MLGSTAFRTAVAPGGVLAGPWVKNELWRRARAVPSLDLRFADNKSLVDATTGQNLVTFTRASSGTFTDSDGLIKSAVINLLLRSEEFESASWTPGQTSVNANVIQSPNGSLTADKLIENSNTSTHLIQQIIAHTSGTTYTASCFVKVAERTFFSIAFGSGFTGSQANSFFDLSNGTTPTSGATVVNVGDGWFRCSFTVAATASASSAVQFRLATSTSVANYTGDGTSGIYLWGAQLEQSSTAGEYIPTTSTINSAPRFDHNPTTGESLGLLVEEARTNLVLNSEQFNDASWTKTNSTITSNTIVSPDGSTTGDSITSNAGILGYVFQNISQITGTAYTLSTFAKANQYTFCQLRIIGAVVGSITRAYFDLAAGTVTGAANCTASIAPVGSGWYRCSITYTTISTATAAPRIYGQVAASDTAGDGTSGIYIWGAQLEVGSFPTSYIPTTTATVTRSADLASITGANFSSFYNQVEGTMFADSVQAVVTPASRLVSASDNTSSNRVALSRGSGSGGNINITVTNAGSAQVSALLLGTGIAAGTPNKVAAVYKAADFAGSVNGLTPVTQGTGTLPGVLTQLSIGSGEALGGNSMNGTIKRLTYWSQRLPNSTLQSITL